MKLQVLVAAVVVWFAPVAGSAGQAICAACVRATMSRLAGDDLQGRGCGTPGEAAAARFIADSLSRSRITGAFGRDAYVQPVHLETPTAAGPATLSLVWDGRQVTLTQGRDFVARQLPETLSGPVARVTRAAEVDASLAGKLVILDSAASEAGPTSAVFKVGALAVIQAAPPSIIARWSEMTASPPGRTVIGGAPAATPRLDLAIFVTPEAMASLKDVTQGAAVLTAPRGAPRLRTTQSVVGVLHGSAADADHRAILLSAHYDHLGVRGGRIFHGANDDASGTAAVLEFARFLGSARPRRGTVYFALFGCEEEGGLAAQYFMAHPPLALDDIAANLEFEMIGVDDPNRPGYLMLTGFERSNLGPTLQAHGARIGPDLYPQENFFHRSDNYQLALKGVVAHTVSAWPVPPTYHAVSDTLDHVDLEFMAKVIGSMVEPITWLLDSNFRPAWNPGQKP